MLTIPQPDFLPFLPSGCAWIRGQLELAASGFLHWQIIVAFSSRQRLRGVKSVFGSTCHAELSRSAAAVDYVWKEDTRVDGTQFDLGNKPINRAVAADWAKIRASAVSGDLLEVPDDIYVRCYHQLRSIGKDHLRPVPMERTCFVFWGRTGTGKSRRAWEEASMDAYPKNPRSKFWDGYRDHELVVMDEFRGAIDISYLLVWLDRYPCIVEVKGSSVVLRARTIWITSNLDPRLWYPEADAETVDALLRRLTITHYQ